MFMPLIPVLLSATLAGAAEMTAFELIKEGNRYVGEQCKDKIVQLRSERSVGTIEPNVWYVVFYDPTAALKATEVRFDAGKMVKVRRPMRLLEPVTGGDTPLDRSKIKIDSDQAIKTVLAEPLLKNVKVTSTELKLERVAQGVLGTDSTGEAAWKVKLWAARIDQPNKSSHIGEIWVGAGDGKVVKTDVNLRRLD